MSYHYNYATKKSIVWNVIFLHNRCQAPSFVFAQCLHANTVLLSLLYLLPILLYFALDKVVSSLLSETQNEVG